MIMTQQEIEFWLKIAGIVIPSLVALIVPFVTYRWLTRKMADYQTILSKEIEDYKKDISKELENYKFQLQSDFQTKFYEFQTKYSVLHQERAKVIQNLFALLTKLSRNARHLESIKKMFSNQQAKPFYDDLGMKQKDIELESITRFLNDYKSLDEFYIGKSIYLNQEICQKVDNLLEAGAKLLIFHTFQSGFEEKFKNSPSEEVFNSFLSEFNKINTGEISKALKLLENDFQYLISAENPNNQLEKNNE